MMLYVFGVIYVLCFMNVIYIVFVSIKFIGSEGSFENDKK